jgi:hypothetical protein
MVFTIYTISNEIKQMKRLRIRDYFWLFRILGLTSFAEYSARLYSHKSHGINWGDWSPDYLCNPGNRLVKTTDAGYHLVWVRTFLSSICFAVVLVRRYTPGDTGGSDLVVEHDGQ